ncbi:MAG: response regulator [Candidatus Korobacteraceae bacterium]|jgi:DNA-binding response OmpR family regulator
MTNVESLKVLLIDNQPDRKERIAVLKSQGFTVYPALDPLQARQRCKANRYDLVIVNAGGNPDVALEVCDQIRSDNQKQPLIMITAPGQQLPDRDFVESSQPETLLKRIRAMFDATLTGKALAA